MLASLPQSRWWNTSVGKFSRSRGTVSRDRPEDAIAARDPRDSYREIVESFGPLEICMGKFLVSIGSSSSMIPVNQTLEG